jgi:hypothetical protein
LQKFDIVTLFLGVYLGIQKFRARNPVYQEVDSCIKNALKLTYEHLEHQKNFPGLRPLDPQGKGREGKGREGNGRERNGTEGNVYSIKPPSSQGSYLAYVRPPLCKSEQRY